MVLGITLLQKQIYRSLKGKAGRLLGETPEAILKYERDYRREFKKLPRSPLTVSKAELTEAIRASDVTLIGDYHTYDQAQRTALRLMRDTILPREPWCLALEMIPSHRQKALDDFQEGKLSEKEFLEEIKYEQSWGFPWKNYAPVIQWAIEHDVKLIALNRPTEIHFNAEDLEKRDEWAAGIITDYFAGAPKETRMLVLFGELHLGHGHLPRTIRTISLSYLKKPLKTLSIHQNQDDLYWRTSPRITESANSILHLKRNSYCVFSGTPWAKLQSLVNWTERLQFAEENEELADLDPLSKMKSHTETLCRFLGEETPSFDSVNLVTIAEADFAGRLPELESFSREELELIRFLVLHGFKFYVPSAQIAYTGTISENALAELGAIHARRSLSGDQDFFLAGGEGFALFVLDNAFGFFGSLLLNPRRKCDWVRDHESRIEELEKNPRSRAFPNELKARQIAVAILKSWSKPDLASAVHRSLGRSRSASVLTVTARYVGQVIGRALYDSALNEPVRFRERARPIFLSNAAERNENSNLDRLELLREFLSESLRDFELPESKSDTL